MTVRRAKEALLVVACKSGYHRGWEWRLEDVQHEGAHPIDTQESAFEHTIENANLNGNRTDEDAHRSEASTFDAFEDDGEVRL